MRPLKMATAVLVLLAASAGPAAGQPPRGGAMPPPQVEVTVAAVRTVPVTPEYVGLTAASKTVEVRARVQGFIESREFSDGAWVEEGATLFKIDRQPFAADREIAAAQLAQAETRLQLARQELARLQSVSAPGAVAAADIDQRAAEAANAAASVRLAKAQLEKAGLNLGYTNITAPLTGYVGKALREVGSFVDTQNSLLAVMEQVDPLYVSFKVTESDFLAWKRDLRDGTMVLGEGAAAPSVEITLLDGTPFESPGVLDFENTGLDIKTGTVELRATFPNRDRLLKPGQFVKARLKGWERPGTLAVPRRAVGQSPRGAYVYVVDGENRAKMLQVRLGPWAGEDWIVLDGLTPGDRVITEGLAKVRDGGTVALAETPEH